ncbi:MAG: hypothetical protein LBR10_12810 [Prevotellaceae bacterium]|jgi:hypothetical protein|nr:hypothetical protein [Prevotellaceae bacterium]
MSNKRFATEHICYVAVLFTFCGLLSAAGSFAQSSGRWEVSGYVSDMASGIMLHPDSAWMWENVVHNRLNLGWQASEHWRVDVGMRNRLIIGDMAKQAGYAESVEADKGWMDLSWNPANGNGTILNATFDRLLVTFEKGRWNLQLGRQRINWGQTLVWNPNDIFNTYSFFDFDYVERPGCDAFRGTYYHNETASTELAVSPDGAGKVTGAMLHRWNRKNFDYQLAAGVYTQSDLMLGGAVSGDWQGLNLRCELSYFRPLENFTDADGVVAAAVGIDYVFANSLMLQTEALYNNVGNEAASQGLSGLYAAPLSAKRQSICNRSIFGQASYPVTPRLTTSASAMYFVEIRSFYTGLSFDYSVIKNLDCSFITQYFAETGRTNSGGMQA